MRNRPIIIAIIAAVVLLILGLLIIPKKPNFSLDVAPSDSALVVDGSKKIKPGKLYLAPGTHKLKATKDGFADKTVSFNVVKGRVTALTVVLIPNTATGLAWLRDHPAEALRREGFGGAQFDQNIKTAKEKLPIISELPLIDKYFRIDYGQSQDHPTDPDAIALYITYYSEDGKQQAIDYLKYKGYDPSKLEIIYDQEKGY